MQDPITTPAFPLQQKASLALLYHDLQEEVNRCNKISSTCTVNWQCVEQKAAALLDASVKHFQVTVYWSIAQLHNHGFSTFTVSIKVLQTLVDSDWETADPPLKRIRGRLNAIVWWLEQLSTWMKQHKDTPIEDQLHGDAIALLTAFDKMLQQRCFDAPSIHPVINALYQLPICGTESATAALPKETVADITARVESEGVLSTHSTAHLAVSPTSGMGSETIVLPTIQAESPPTPDTISMEGEGKVAQALQTLIDVADYYLHQDSADPLSYHYRRLSLWGNIIMLPLKPEVFSPPEPACFSQLEKECQQQQWSTLIKRCESALNCYPLWLTLNFWVYRALTALGHTVAAHIVEIAVRALLLRFPSLTQHTFSDDTPLLSNAGAEWLTPHNNSPKRAISSEWTLHHLITQTNDQADQGELKTALQLLQQHAAALPRASQLRLHCQLARLLYRAKHKTLALARLQQMLEVVDHHDLEQWDPVLAEEVLATAYELLRAMGQSEAATKSLTRLSLLNPTKAIEHLAT